MSSTSTSKDSLEVFFNLKTLILSNAKLLHGGSSGARPRTYDITTSRKTSGQSQYRVSLIAYDESHKGPGKVDVDSKTLTRSAVKTTLNAAMEDLLKRTQEELWKD